MKETAIMTVNAKVVLFISALIMGFITQASDSACAHSVHGHVIVGDELGLEIEGIQCAGVEEHAAFQTGQALAIAVTNKVHMTEDEKASFIVGFEEGIRTKEFPLDLKLMNFVVKTYINERSRVVSSDLLNERTETAKHSDEIKTEIMGYIIGLSLSNEMNLSSEESGDMTQGVLDAFADPLINDKKNIAENVVTFIDERTIDLANDSSIYKMRISSKLYNYLQRIKKQG